MCLFSLLNVTFCEFQKDGESESEEEDSDDDDDDGVNVVIGDVKSGQQFGSAKRPGPPPDKKVDIIDLV